MKTTKDKSYLVLVVLVVFMVLLLVAYFVIETRPTQLIAIERNEDDKTFNVEMQGEQILYRIDEEQLDSFVVTLVQY